MTEHKGFVEECVKTEKVTMCEGVTEKDTRTGFWIELVERIGM